MVRYLILVILIATGAKASAADPLEANVQLLNRSSSNPETPIEMIAAASPAGTAVATQGIPPQYLRDQYDLESQEEDAPLRLFLPLPDRILIIDASVLIDDLPFSKIRERRVQALAKEMQRIQKTGSDSPPGNAPAIALLSELLEKAGLFKFNEIDSAFLERLKQYQQATRRTPTVSEIHWLLEHEESGPPLLTLTPHYERIRRHQSPLFTALDADGDKILNQGEQDAVPRTLIQIDRNQDETITFAEISSFAAARALINEISHPAPIPAWLAPSAMASPFQFNKLRDYYSENGHSQALSRFDSNENGTLDGEELKSIRSLSADLSITTVFMQGDGKKSRLTVSLSESLESAVSQKTDENAILLQFSGTQLEISAVQIMGNPPTDQVSFGAVWDGYPLLPHVNTISDGRLTIRELRQIPAYLKQQDTNQDQRLTADELPQTLRLCFGHGVSVHQQLAQVRAVHTSSEQPHIAVPEWFRRMDRNEDYDLTIKEFLGGKAQFEKLDKDDDGLISSEEAAQSE